MCVCEPSSVILCSQAQTLVSLPPCRVKGLQSGGGGGGGGGGEQVVMPESPPPDSEPTSPGDADLHYLHSMQVYMIVESKARQYRQCLKKTLKLPWMGLICTGL